MVVADPTLTATQGAASSRASWPRRLHVDYFTTLQRAARSRTAGSPTSPAASRPRWRSSVVDAGRGRRATRASTPATTRCAPTPADDVAANLVGFMGTDGPLAGLELHLQPAAGRHGRLGDLRGRRRQPDPARRQHRRCRPVNGTDLHTTIDRDLQWYTQRVLRQTVLEGPAATPASRSSWTPTPARCSSLADYPTYDANNPQAVAEERPATRWRMTRRLRAGLGREGAHPQRR